MGNENLNNTKPWFYWPWCVIRFGILGLTTYLSIYFFCYFLLSGVAIKEIASEDKKVEIFLVKSGVHTDFMLPLKNEYQDWTVEFPIENTQLKDTNVYFLTVGWGDKNFYMNTPTWGDLTVKTALFAATGMGTSALHATHYYEVPTDRPVAHLFLSEAQYKDLIDYIKNTLRRDKNGKNIFIKPMNEAVMCGYDAYYEAKNSYSMLSTCNSWINNGLKACGKKACLWSPFAGGIFYQYGF